MNTTIRSSARSTAELDRINGRNVLVMSAQDRGNPPTGRRGWVELRHDVEGRVRVQIAIEFPQMFTSAAHHRTVPLSDEQIAELLASEREGTFFLVLPESLDPGASPGNE
jgi:hypothetical protein